VVLSGVARGRPHSQPQLLYTALNYPQVSMGGQCQCRFALPLLLLLLLGASGNVGLSVSVLARARCATRH
jgi:hypothetical protein